MGENTTVEEVQVENQVVPEKEIVEIDRVIFKEVSDDELFVVNEIKNGKSIKKFISRMIISIVVILVIYIIQCAGELFKDHSVKYVLKNKEFVWEACSNYLLLAIASFIIFNAISWFCLFVKRQLVALTENYYILLEAQVTDKYLGKKIHVEGKGRKKNYIVFECDQGICSMALEVDRKSYKNTMVGDKIVVLKTVTVDGFSLNYLKEDAYKNIFNSKIKNA